MSVEFHDNSIQVKDALEDAVYEFLTRASGELETQTIRNSSPEKYRGKPAQQLWKRVVNESAKEAKVGSDDEAGFWEELGTGEYALNHDGRKGWWVYVEGNDSPRSNQKYYTKQEAEQAAAFLRSQGLDAHATNGRKPNRPLHRAYTAKKSSIIRMAKEIFGERLK